MPCEVCLCSRLFNCHVSRLIPAPCYYVAARRRRGAADCVPQTASYRDEADFHLKCKYGAATRSAPPHTGTRCTLATLLSGSVPVRILMINININKLHKNEGQKDIKCKKSNFHPRLMAAPSKRLPQILVSPRQNWLGGQGRR